MLLLAGPVGVPAGPPAVRGVVGVAPRGDGGWPGRGGLLRLGGPHPSVVPADGDGDGAEEEVQEDAVPRR